MPAPAPVSSCQGLGAVGVWEKIDPPGVGAHAVAADPHQPGVVYLGADHDDGMYDDGRGLGLYKSSDCGARFQKASTGRNGAVLDRGRLWTLVMHPRTPGTMYTTSGYGAVGWWRSTNGGVDWDEITPRQGVNLLPGSVPAPDFVTTLAIDPLDPEHQFLTYHTSCSPVWGEWGCVSETRDGGNTWKVLTRDNPKFGMEVRAYPIGGNRFLVGQELKDAQGRSYSEMHLTEDGGQTYTKVTDVGYGGHDAVMPYRAANGKFYLGSAYGLQEFSADGRVWKTVPDIGQNVVNVVGDGTTMFVHARSGVWKASEADGSRWTRVAADIPRPEPDRLCWMALDKVHKLLYAACWFDLYRMRYEP